MPLNSHPAEHRQASRRRQLKAAVIADQGSSTYPCTLRDISETGCRLALDARVLPRIPDKFRLSVDIDGLFAECSVVWRSQKEIGAIFLQPPEQGKRLRNQVIGTRQSQSPILRTR